LAVEEDLEENQEEERERDFDEVALLEVS